MNDTGSDQQYDALVIGAGFGGLYALHHLRDKLGLRVRAFDGASGVGGTWWYNRYPGARVDAPSSPYYAFTFSQDIVDEWTWTETQTAGEDVRAYLEFVADRLDLIKDIQFDSPIVDAIFDEDAQRWTIETASGEHLATRFLVCAMGALFVANNPDYPGFDKFAGECFHTGRWPHEEVSFKGKRVGVIGTGSSGIQCIPEIAKEADHVTVFQRTPQYSIPARNRTISAEEIDECRSNWKETREIMRNGGGLPFQLDPKPAADYTPEERREFCEQLWQTGGVHLAINSFVEALSDEDINEEIGEFVRGKIREIVKDADTARKLLPSYHFATKRLVLDNGYYETFNRDNITLVDLREDPIQEFTSSTVRTKDGEHAIDMLVLATGFDALSGSMLRLNPKGRNGVRLKEKWSESFDNYLGSTISGFPNLFMIHGPGSPGVFFTMPFGGELTGEFVGKCISHVCRNGLGTIEATTEAEEAWAHEVNGIANETLYPRTDSWYTGANIPGKPRQFLGHLQGSLYFDRLFEVAGDGFEGFVFESRHEEAVNRPS